MHYLHWENRISLITGRMLWQFFVWISVTNLVTEPFFPRILSCLLFSPNFVLTLIEGIAEKHMKSDRTSWKVWSVNVYVNVKQSCSTVNIHCRWWVAVAWLPRVDRDIVGVWELVRFLYLVTTLIRTKHTHNYPYFIRLACSFYYFDLT